ncbi:unnamed protein product, partial [Adineta ricciae]
MDAIVAGRGTRGYGSDELSWPHGIFVDTNSDLFVADFDNGRVQLFPFGERNAITLVGFGSKYASILLQHPSEVVLDAYRYLFILDTGNRRIIQEEPNGFRCFVGCSEEVDSQIRFNGPSSMSLDSFGNMFVVYSYGDHIEKFQFLENSCGFAFNQPKFCSKSVWSQNGMTVADQFTLGSKPSALFIDKKNLIYSINRETMKILVWHQGNIEPTKTIFTGFFNSSSLFVALNGDIYIDNGARSAVKAWILNKKVFIDAMSVFSSCTSLFIDLNDYLYCSMSNHHQIIKKRLHERIMTWTSAAGTGVKGSSSTELDNPYGIFIDSSSNLYVTDCGNDRIQKFRPNVVGGTTEVGRALPARFQYSLSCPTGITLDAQGFLFVVDSKNHRVLRSGISHMRCVLGCDGISIKSTQFLFPSTLAFDSDGNMFVMDSGNHRIRKFQYS